MDLQQTDLDLAFLFPEDYQETWTAAGMGFSVVPGAVLAAKVRRVGLPLVVGGRWMQNSRQSQNTLLCEDRE
jgi:hypothetical protein